MIVAACRTVASGGPHLAGHSENSKGRSMHSYPAPSSSCRQSWRVRPSSALPANLGFSHSRSSRNFARCTSSASTMFRLGESHFFLHFRHGAAGDGAGVLGPVREILAHPGRIRRDFLGARTNWSELILHRLVKDFLAVDAAPPGSAALVSHVLHSRGRTERVTPLVGIA